MTSLFSRLQKLNKRMVWAWRTRTLPWKLHPSWPFIDARRPSDEVFRHAEKLARERKWKDIVP